MCFLSPGSGQLRTFTFSPLGRVERVSSSAASGPGEEEEGGTPGNIDLDHEGSNHFPLLIILSPYSKKMVPGMPFPSVHPRNRLLLPPPTVLQFCSPMHCIPSHIYPLLLLSSLFFFFSQSGRQPSVDGFHVSGQFCHCASLCKATNAHHAGSALH